MKGGRARGLVRERAPAVWVHAKVALSLIYTCFQPLKNPSTLQPWRERPWNSVKNRLKGLIFKPFRKVQPCSLNHRVWKTWAKRAKIPDETEVFEQKGFENGNNRGERAPTSCPSARNPAFSPKLPMKPCVFEVFEPFSSPSRPLATAPPAPNPGFGATNAGFEISNAGFGFPKAGFVAPLPPPVFAPPSHPPAPHPFAPEKAETRLNTAEGLEN